MIQQIKRQTLTVTIERHHMDGMDPTDTDECLLAVAMTAACGRQVSVYDDGTYQVAGSSDRIRLPDVGLHVLDSVQAFNNCDLAWTDLMDLVGSTFEISINP